MTDVELIRFYALAGILFGITFAVGALVAWGVSHFRHRREMKQLREDAESCPANLSEHESGSWISADESAPPTPLGTARDRIAELERECFDLRCVIVRQAETISTGRFHQHQEDVLEGNAYEKAVEYAERFKK